jgi:hypothetical protein
MQRQHFKPMNIPQAARAEDSSTKTLLFRPSFPILRQTLLRTSARSYIFYGPKHYPCISHPRREPPLMFYTNLGPATASFSTYNSKCCNYASQHGSVPVLARALVVLYKSSTWGFLNIPHHDVFLNINVGMLQLRFSTQLFTNPRPRPCPCRSIQIQYLRLSQHTLPRRLS